MGRTGPDDAPASCAARRGASLKPAADALLRGAADAGDVPGVVALVAGPDAILYAGAFGTRVIGHAPAMTLDTVGWIASWTKAITSVAALQLVERGRLALHAPVSRWVPEIAAIQVLEGFDPDGRPRLRAPLRPVTLAHLLTHTAGFGYAMWSEALRRYQADATAREPTGGNFRLRLPLLFDPGARWEYGVGTDWVGRLVEVASGQMLGAYFAQHVFGPLAMTDTAFRASAAMQARRAPIHQRGADGGLVVADPAGAPVPAFESGGGGLHGTAGDYLKFLQMILNRGRAGTAQVLQPESIDLLTHGQTGPLQVTCLRTAQPALSNDVEFFPGLPKHYSYGFQVNAEAAPTGLSAGSLMWAGLANTNYWVDPRRAIAGVYLTQILPFGDARAVALYLAFQALVYRALG